MTVEEALQFFLKIFPVSKKISCKPYMMSVFPMCSWGQSSTTLSGGEAQRVKLATELSRKSTGKNGLYSG